MTVFAPGTLYVHGYPPYSREMKYLTIIYYDSFARFFSAIEDEVKKLSSECEFLHLAIFPSGWLFMKRSGRNTILLPLELKRSGNLSLPISELELDKTIAYHLATSYIDKSAKRKRLEDRARRYIRTAQRIVDEFQPDVILFSGDTRIVCETFRLYLNKVGFKGRKYFFEQGPNGTTIFDTEGVNANCSFRERLSSLTGKDYSPEQVRKPQRYKRNPIYRGADYAIIGLLRLLGMVPPEWDSMSLKKFGRRKYDRCFKKNANAALIKKGEVLIALQVPDDANNVHHNPLGLHDIDLVRMVVEATSLCNVAVCVREHPLYRRRYTATMYDYVLREENVSLSGASLDEDLDRASVVVTVNSMTAIDAYLRNKPVIVLGNAFYDHFPGIARLSDPSKLGETIEAFLNGGRSMPETMDPASIFAEFRDRHLISGHYMDEDLRSPRLIARMLMGK